MGETLLENLQKTISPPPQRIIWYYGQWNRNEGIPDDIENADSLEVSQRNLIVLNDLVAQSDKDKRTADLFTKVSHHQNLSVSILSKIYFIRAKK